MKKTNKSTLKPIYLKQTEEDCLWACCTACSHFQLQFREFLNEGAAQFLKYLNEGTAQFQEWLNDDTACDFFWLQFQECLDEGAQQQLQFDRIDRWDSLTSHWLV